MVALSVEHFSSVAAKSAGPRPVQSTSARSRLVDYQEDASDKNPYN
jgi:hypothetical protein